VVLGQEGDREDLLQTLDRAVTKRVTVISAPPGSGKTSLLRAWADRSTDVRRVAFVFVERRVKAPLVDLTFFARRSFVMGVAIGSLSMFSILSLLLYFNLYAQSREGLGLTALEAGAALLPLSAALLALALSASAVAARLGLRNAMRGGMALIAIASAVIGTAVAGGGMVLLAIGFFVMGAGLAVPYALAPRLALSALAPTQAGQGSGIINACTFLGGSCGVAGGATALALGGFPAVLTMIALAGIIGAALSHWISETV